MKIEKIFTMLIIVICMAMVPITSNAMGVDTFFHNWGYASVGHIENMGIDWMRDMQDWRNVEVEKGKLQFDETRKETYRRMKQQGKHIVLCFGGGHTAYVEGNTHIVMPTKDNEEYFEAWLNYVRFTARECKGLIDAYEIWNEPNYPQYNSNATGAQYGELFAETYKAIKEVDPDVLVLGGAIAAGNDASFAFLKEFYNNGGSMMDALSYHLYGTASMPEAEWTKRCKAMETTLDEIGYEGTLFLTESGWYTGTYKAAVSEDMQGAYLIRVGALWDGYLHEEGREGTFFWFCVMNWGKNLAHSEENFGLMDSGFFPKTSYYSMKAFNSITKNKEITSLNKEPSRYRNSEPVNYKYLAEYTNPKTKEKSYIAWNADEKRQVKTKIPLSGDYVEIYDFCGDIIDTIDNPSGSIDLWVDEYPKIVVCKKDKTEIESFKYDKSKNVLSVSGTNNYSSEVTIELEKDGKTIQSEIVPVRNGLFKKDISVKASGEIKIYAGRREGELYDEAVFVSEAKRKAHILSDGNIINYDSQLRRVTVKGSVSGDSNCATILVIPKKADIYELTAHNIAYIGETEIVNGIFKHEFTMPENSEGEYIVMLGAVNANETRRENLNTGISNGYIAIGAFKMAEDDNLISASSLCTNLSEEDKTVSMILSQYDSDDRLCGVEFKTFAVEALRAHPKAIFMSAEKVSTAVRTAAFMFESFESLEPLTNKAEIILNKF